ncbi:hypothetical protein [Micromonospora carbonacea]|uniref:hypothetical protein n=1 Tax=Micromonospora carbonacea TaxID=47853 RepID=UPI003714EEBD
MSPSRMYQDHEKSEHEPRDCPACGEQEETVGWSPDDRTIGTGKVFYLPSDACTNPDCRRGPRPTFR